MKRNPLLCKASFKPYAAEFNFWFRYVNTAALYQLTNCLLSEGFSYSNTLILYRTNLFIVQQRHLHSTLLNVGELSTFISNKLQRFSFRESRSIYNIANHNTRHNYTLKGDDENLLFKMHRQIIKKVVLRRRKLIKLN